MLLAWVRTPPSFSSNSNNTRFVDLLSILAIDMHTPSVDIWLCVLEKSIYIVVPDLGGLTVYLRRLRGPSGFFVRFDDENLWWLKIWKKTSFSSLCVGWLVFFGLISQIGNLYGSNSGLLGIISHLRINNYPSYYVKCLRNLLFWLKIKRENCTNIYFIKSICLLFSIGEIVYIRKI